MNKDCKTISPDAVCTAANALDKAAKEKLPILHQGDEVLVVELTEKKECSTCRWGDKSLLDDRYLCWGLETVDAEICRKNEFSNWEPKGMGDLNDY